MTRFSATLRRADAALDLPVSVRARIMAEIASDLEALFEAYRARGLADDEARAKAARVLGVTPEVARELGRLHEPRYRRWTAKLSARGRTTIEQRLVTVLTGALVIGAAMGLAAGDFLRAPSIWVWPLLVIGLLVPAAAAVLAIRLYVAGESRGANNWLHLTLAIAPLSVALSLIAVVYELDSVARAVIEAGAFTASAVAPGVRRAAQSSALGLVIALAAFLVWFHMRRRFVSIKRAESELVAALAVEGTP